MLLMRTWLGILPRPEEHGLPVLALRNELHVVERDDASASSAGATGCEDEVVQTNALLAEPMGSHRARRVAPPPVQSAPRPKMGCWLARALVRRSWPGRQNAHAPPDRCRAPGCPAR
jgi:hypothetical protein